jgi:hypothetical protein
MAEAVSAHHARRLRRALEGAACAPLIVLNACDSGTILDSSTFGSLPPELIRSEAIGVLAFQFIVPVKTAQVFFAEFCRSLVNSHGNNRGNPDWATYEGRRALEGNPRRAGTHGSVIEKKVCWLPVYYKKGANFRLLREFPGVLESGARSSRALPVCIPPPSSPRR